MTKPMCYAVIGGEISALAPVVVSSNVWQCLSGRYDLIGMYIAGCIISGRVDDNGAAIAR